MDGPLSLGKHELVTTPDEEGNAWLVRSALDQKHVLAARAERNLADLLSLSKLLSLDILKPLDDPCTGCDGKLLNIATKNPTNGWKVPHVEEVVSLIIEAPLAHDGGSASLLKGIDLVNEVLLFLLVELLVFLSSSDGDLVLGLWLGWLEWAGQNGNLSVLNNPWHLAVAPGLVDNETVEELGIFEAATDLADEFDTLEVDVLALEIGNAEDSLDGHAGELVPETRNDLGVQGGLANLVKKGVVGWGEVKGLADLFEALHGDVAGAVEAFGDSEWVEANNFKINIIQNIFLDLVEMRRNGVPQSQETVFKGRAEVKTKT